MNIVFDRDEPILTGRSEECLLDVRWWMALSRQEPEAIMIMQNPNGTFSSVTIEFPSANAVDEFRYKLGKL